MHKAIEIALARIRQLPQRPAVIAIDGRCAAGKTTLAAALQAQLHCPVFHMDDFFLQPAQRTPERYAQPGGNVDHERFRREVLAPLLQGTDVTYRPFDCHQMAMKAPVTVPHAPVSIIEGTYSCHPALWDAYALRIFVTTDPETQLSRIHQRNGANAAMFQQRWIPLEERYFSAYDISGRCDLLLHT